MINWSETQETNTYLVRQSDNLSDVRTTLPHGGTTDAGEAKTSPRYTDAIFVAAKIAAGGEPTLQDKLAVYQVLNRVWRKHLTPDEGWVMLYLVDRSVGWGSDSFTAMTANVLEGTGEFAGIGLPRRTYFRVMNDLEAKGLIARRSLRDKTKVVLNIGWEPGKEMSLPKPKRLKQGQECHGGTSRSAKSALQECHGGTQNTVVGTNSSLLRETSAFAPASRPLDPLEESLSPEKKEGADFSAAENSEDETGQWDTPAPEMQPVAAPDLFANVRRRVRAVQSEHRETLSERAAVVREKPAKLNASGVEAVWRAAMIEAQPLTMHVAWSIKDKGRVNALIKKWAFDKEGTVADLVDYAVRNWATICARKFGWMTKEPAPSFPVLDFLLWRQNDFVEAWMNKTACGFIQDSKNSAYDRLRAGGLTHEEALAEIGRQDATRNMREEMERRERAARQRDRAATDKLAKAERFEKLAETATTGERPIVTLPNGQQAEVIPGTKRRPGQAWGHTPMLKPIAPTPGVPDFDQAMRERAESARTAGAKIDLYKDQIFAPMERS